MLATAASLQFAAEVLMMVLSCHESRAISPTVTGQDVAAAVHAPGGAIMGRQFYVFLLLIAILILLIARLAMLTGKDRKLKRAVGLLRKGMLPSKLEERLVAEGMARRAASELIEQALRALSPARITAPSSAARHPSQAASPRRGSGAPHPEVVESAPVDDLPSTPHERGVALLYRKGDYAGAIEAFTQAIELDPLYPNAYLGRAVARRRLDQLAEARADEQKAEELGGAEKSAWDRLVNRSRHRWQWDFDNPAWERTDPLSRKAVLLHTLITQIHKGGLHQWVANGYWRWIDDVIKAAREVDTAATRAVAAMLEDLSRGISPEAMHDAWREDDTVEEDPAHDEERDEALGRIWEHEERYHRVEFPFRDDVEKWLEEQAAARREEPRL
jgi:hypothetical protein